jgi:hypothetical protein
MPLKKETLRIRVALALFAIIALLFAANSLPAQVNTASFTGLVTDQSNAVMAGVHVTVADRATGFTRTVDTDTAGYYSFENLPIATYTVTVTKDGFSTLQATVTLDTAEKGRQDFSMQLGATTQTVEVTASASDLSRDDASIGTVVDNETIQETPLYLRNWDDLLRTVSGVQINRYTQQSGCTCAGRVGDFNVHGIHSLQNDFILDGIDNNTFSENVQELSTESSHPSVDTIQEFKIITNPYSAEYGRSPGAAVSVSTKGGTNQFHGVAYEYLRNNLFDANDWFSDRSHLRKPENNQNQFGGNFGGPIMKDKLFGFFDYEGTRIKQAVSRTTTVPLPNERIGDFSPETAAALGLPAYPTIYNQSTGQPFADNKIPSGMIDSVMSQLIALFPQPNLPGDVNNYTRNALAQDNDDSYDGRVDWSASPNDTIFGRFSYSNRFRFIPGNLGGIADGTSTSAWGRQYLKAWSFVLGWTHQFTPNLVNDFHAGFVRNYSFAVQDPFGKNAANQFVPGIPNNPAIAGGVPQTSFSNFGFLGSPDFLPKRQIPQQYQWTDTISLTKGPHAFKFGGTLWAPMRNIFQDEPGMRGDMGFTGVFTCQRTPTEGCVSGTGLSYADGLLGDVQSDQLTNVYFVDQRIWMASAFGEDDWKVTPKLTLNLGLRYDFATPALESKNAMANFNPSGNGGAGSLVFATGGSLEQRALVQTNKKDFSPRFGFAYSLGSNTVIRGGYGVYYTLFERYGSEDQLGLNPPYLINKTASSNVTPVLTPHIGFPANYLDPSTINLNALQLFHIRTMNPHDPSPMVQQWSFGLQHEFGPQWLAELNYVGTHSTHLDVLGDYNQFLFSGNSVTICPAGGSSNGIPCTANQPVVPFPNFGYIEYTNAIGSGRYNGMEASLTRRMAAGLSVKAAYTYSRTIDDSPQELETNSGAPPNGRNFNAWFGPSDFDVPHRVSISYVYELPFGHGKQFLKEGIASWILGGWQTSGVYTYYSGHPFTVNEGGTLQSQLDLFGQATAVPNVTGKPQVLSNPNCWFYVSKNTACKTLAPSLTDVYSQTASGVIGNSGRNTLRGPSTDVFDFALVREIPIQEKANVEFRWEVFNLTNTPEFGQPSGNITSSAVGTITTLSGDPRVMQFALRLSF